MLTPKPEVEIGNVVGRLLAPMEAYRTVKKTAAIGSKMAEISRLKYFLVLGFTSKPEMEIGNAVRDFVAPAQGYSTVKKPGNQFKNERKIGGDVIFSFWALSPNRKGNRKRDKTSSSAEGGLPLGEKTAAIGSKTAEILRLMYFFGFGGLPPNRKRKSRTLRGIS